MFNQDLENERLKREDMKKEIERNRIRKYNQTVRGEKPEKIGWPSLFGKKEKYDQPFKY